jgi:hypothetical protein
VDHPDPDSIPSGVDIGLPHGRAWVRETYACTCVLCVPPAAVARPPVSPTHEEPRTDLRWVTTKGRGFGAVEGPPSVVWPGATVEVFNENTRRHRTVRITHVGKVFERGGQRLRYGYPARPGTPTWGSYPAKRRRSRRSP